MKHVLIALLFLFNSSLFCDDYEFTGVHYVASYIDCKREALCNIPSLRNVVLEGVAASGATILDSCEYVFPPDSITLVVLLSESHASIHTYPEHNSCYVDLFTCGDRCDYRHFEKVLQEYLQPKTLETKILRR